MGRLTLFPARYGLNVKSEINKQLRRFTSFMLLIQITSIILVLCVLVSLNYISKVRMANLVALTTRSQILSGDFRQVIRTLDNTQKEEFIAIRYYGRNSDLTFSIPPESNPRTTREKSLFNPTVKVPVRSGFDSAQEVGHLEFDFSVFNGMFYAILVCLFLIGASIPLAGLYRSWLQKKYRLESLALKNEAIALTTQMIAHDVRHPFSVLQRGLAVINQSVDLSSFKSTSQKLIPELNRSLSRIEILFSDILNVGKKENLALNLSAINLSEVLSDCYEEIKAQAGHKEIRFELDLCHKLVKPLFADKIMLERVLLNILGNAVQAIPTSGSISLLTHSTPETVVIEIMNTGSHIDEESLGMIFDAFYTKGKAKGNGLGLAIAKKFISDHGGTIVCKSEKNINFPDGMVKFEITLPLGNATYQETPPSSISKHSVQNQPESLAVSKNAALAPTRSSQIKDKNPGSETKMKILFIDDSEIIRMSWVATLSPVCSIVTLKNFTELKQKLNDDPRFYSELSAVITDMNFDCDTGSGREVSRLVQQLAPHVPVYLSSDGNYDHDVEQKLFIANIGKNPDRFLDLLGLI